MFTHIFFCRTPDLSSGVLAEAEGDEKENEGGERAMMTEADEREEAEKEIIRNR